MLKEGEKLTVQFDNLVESLQGAIAYIPVVLQLTFVTFIWSFFIGFLIAIIRNYKVPILSKVLGAFVTIYMGLPLMVALVVYQLLFLTYYENIAQFFHLSQTISGGSQLIVAYIALISAGACSYSETIRGALLSVDRVQYEAAYAIGLTKSQAFFRIILPQAIPTIIPGLINNLVGTIKGTNLVSAIGIMEIMGGAIYPCSKTYSYLEGYIAAALVYWLISFVIETIAKRVEVASNRFRRKLA